MLRSGQSKKMLGQFPTPYPDELLYSICARFEERVAYPNKKSVLVELFGERTAVAVMDLPSHVGVLERAIPNRVISAHQLINNHTLLPYYAPFLKSSTVKLLKKKMVGSNGSSIHS